MATVADVWLTSSVDPWRNLGFAVSAVSQPDGSLAPFVVVAGLGIRFVSDPADSLSPAGRASGWTLVGENLALTSLDGLDTRIVADAPVVDRADNSLQVESIDHIVITTGSLERTCGAISDKLGLPLKRIRDAGRGVRQGFHRAGAIILEVVERPDLAPETPAEIWGFVFVVADLDGVVRWLGPDVIGAPRDAVQSGRRIASFKKEVGLGVPIALMSPHVR